MKRPGLFDVQSHSLRPLWLRVLIVALVCAWAISEVLREAWAWAALSGAAAIYLIHQLLIAFDPGPPPGED
ncbi:hypothetical protein RM543_11080 [Roseicyclus sp. F158]|uniref:DUF3329 domain-containing protein n=1 Tax=Tropicimonas omnivorans TaxID=3075590 RepID=A0ABU3DJD5_9RHOB|nr:hypothetical protein [Roseicyclus sp. F158]MDT0683232.1 hypothetical protein [Roseicyclus sp. F158]